jgi:hypothetical protein
VAKQDDGDEFVEISMFLWSVQSFNIIRVVKKMLGFEVI